MVFCLIRFQASAPAPSLALERSPRLSNCGKTCRRWAGGGGRMIAVLRAHAFLASGVLMRYERIESILLRAGAALLLLLSLWQPG